MHREGLLPKTASSFQRAAEDTEEERQVIGKSDVWVDER